MKNNMIINKKITITLVFFSYLLSLIFTNIIPNIRASEDDSNIVVADNLNYRGPKLKTDSSNKYSTPEEYRGSYPSSMWNNLSIFFRTVWGWKNDYFRSCEDAIEKWYKPSSPSESSDEAKINWIGHSSFLVQVDNLNILTDPVFEDLNSTLYPRKMPPGIAFEDLPKKIDVVLISHNHRDHMEESTLLRLKKIDPQPLFLVPIGLAKWFTKNGFKNVRELNWGDDVLNIGKKNVKITFLPAQHSSGSGIGDQMKSGWGSWLIEAKGKKIYFAGDTGYSKHFKDIAKYIGKIDIAMMPIGPNEPTDKMKGAEHISAEEAVDAFLELNADHFVPMHWGTFQLGTDSFISPIDRLEKKWKTISPEKINGKTLDILPFGGNVLYP